MNRNNLKMLRIEPQKIWEEWDKFFSILCHFTIVYVVNMHSIYIFKAAHVTLLFLYSLISSSFLSFFHFSFGSTWIIFNIFFMWTILVRGKRDKESSLAVSLSYNSQKAFIENMEYGKFIVNGMNAIEIKLKKSSCNSFE